MKHKHKLSAAQRRELYQFLLEKKQQELRAWNMRHHIETREFEATLLDTFRLGYQMGYLKGLSDGYDRGRESTNNQFF